ncbi:hypothetical protein BX666DRAFT_1915188 [Dichotomocladium elegans]|nr:hypothetical protein BX666DRAFT_1915188 [Dichotomocladium elegans]
MVFNKHSALASYYHDLLDVIRSFSYQLDTSGKLVIERDTADPVRHSHLFKVQAHGRLVRFLEQQKERASAENDTAGTSKNGDTAIFPVIQMGPLGIRQDEQITMALLGLATKDWVIHLTSGYFNFTDRYKAMILRAPAQFRFLTASPEANGFFNSKGVSKYLPPAYTWIEKQFYNQVRRAGRAQEITIEEYRRPGWTYHAKGLWATLTRDAGDIAVTMIGSPNFGHRSSTRDLEAQALIITKNSQLQQALHKEVQGLHSHAQVVTEETFDRPDRQVPYGVRAATAMIKTML